MGSGRKVGRRRERGRLKRRRWKKDGAEARGLEKLQIIRALLAGAQSSAVVDLPDPDACIHIN